MDRVDSIHSGCRLRTPPLTNRWPVPKMIYHSKGRHLDSSKAQLERVARTLGDTGWGAFRRVTLPLAGRGVLAGSILAWSRSVSEFGSIVILTYNPKVASIYIFDRFTAFGLQAAVPAAVILLLVALTVLIVVRVLQPEDRR